MSKTKLYENWLRDNLPQRDIDKFVLDLMKYSLFEQKMFNPLTAQAVEVLKHELCKSYEGLIPFTIYNMIFNNNFDEFINSLEVDVRAEIANIEDYKNSLEDE